MIEWNTVTLYRQTQGSFLLCQMAWPRKAAGQYIVNGYGYNHTVRDVREITNISSV